MSVVFSCCFQEPRSSKRRMKEKERAKKHDRTALQTTFP